MEQTSEKMGAFRKALHIGKIILATVKGGGNYWNKFCECAEQDRQLSTNGIDRKFQQAMACEFQGLNLDEERQWAHRMQRTAPNNPLGWIYEGYIDANEGQRDRALERFQTALRKCDEVWPRYSMLEETCRESIKWAQAITPPAPEQGQFER